MTKDIFSPEIIAFITYSMVDGHLSYLSKVMQRICCIFTVMHHVFVYAQDFGLQVHLLCDTNTCSRAMTGAADSYGDWRAFLHLHCTAAPAGDVARPSCSEVLLRDLLG